MSRKLTVARCFLGRRKITDEVGNDAALVSRAQGALRYRCEGGLLPMELLPKT